MSTFKAAKTNSIFTLMAILLMLSSGMALAGEKGGYLGVILQDINTGMAKAMDLDDEDGVLVSEVVDGSPADEAGLQDGDVIIKFKGKDLKSHSALTKAVGKSSPGEKVELVILRDGKKKTVEVELGERKEHTMVFFGDEDGDSEKIKIMINDLDFLHEERGFMGVELDDINEQMGEYFDVKDGEGALITSVTEDSAAEAAGLEAGDVIVKMDGEDIESAEDVHSALAGTEPEQKMELRVIRKGKKKTLEITLGEVPENQMFKHIEMIGGDHNIFMKSPKIMNHGMKKAHRMHKEMRIICDEEDDDLKEMRHELEKMKKELKKMKSELKDK